MTNKRSKRITKSANERYFANESVEKRDLRLKKMAESMEIRRNNYTDEQREEIKNEKRKKYYGRKEKQLKKECAEFPRCEVRL